MQEKQVVKNSAKKVTVKFNVTMKNNKFNYEQYEGCRKEYMAEQKELHGRYLALPNEDAMILLRLQAKYQEPYFFNKGMAYQMDEEDATYYIEKYDEHIISDKPRVIENTDLDRYMEKIYYAEVV